MLGRSGMGSIIPRKGCRQESPACKTGAPTQSVRRRISGHQMGRGSLGGPPAPGDWMVDPVVHGAGRPARIRAAGSSSICGNPTTSSFSPTPPRRGGRDRAETSAGAARAVRAGPGSGPGPAGDGRTTGGGAHRRDGDAHPRAERQPLLNAVRVLSRLLARGRSWDPPSPSTTTAGAKRVEDPQGAGSVRSSWERYADGRRRSGPRRAVVDDLGAPVGTWPGRVPCGKGETVSAEEKVVSLRVPHRHHPQGRSPQYGHKVNLGSGASGLVFARLRRTARAVCQ